ncbi:uncharacterized protein JN550_008120 [Neoarthrinium moseri]|uniref:uncharacterized protein n=1 Tax=Neoarthrinium moseri TaxID=1658444 RepID=UPI001FDE2B9D|nr:uncharacterized protein JN550_008120 [Neoarthrinium moseri]KAI1865862.1 hypothetical protein JN550_008120 [Neoarthrinium moseri]
MSGDPIWSNEETQYLKALLSFNASAPSLSVTPQPEEVKKQSVGEFKILVVGAKGCGKSAVISKFRTDDLPSAPVKRDDHLETSCRHQIQVDGLYYTVEALEYPSRDLLSDPQLSHAIDVTEAAVLMYDIKNRDSLQLVKGIYELVRDTVGVSDYGLLLLGNKSDCEDDEREIPWADGSKVAAAFQAETTFMETSCYAGNQGANAAIVQVEKVVLSMVSTEASWADCGP